jgi:hypothetical protein
MRWGGVVGRGERGCKTTKPAKGEGVPAGVVTVIVRGPGSAFAAIITNTDRFVDVPPGSILALIPVPLNVTAVVPVRLVPVIAMTKVVPGIPIVGVTEVIVGVAEMTVKLTAAEVPPPEDGLTTTTFRVPDASNRPAGITTLRVVEVR